MENQSKYDICCEAGVFIGYRTSKLGGAENGTEESKYSHQDKKEDCIQQQECQQQCSVFIVQDKGEAQ